jgi:hypothetical protein
MDSRKGKFRILQLGVSVGERSHAKAQRRKEKDEKRTVSRKQQAGEK